MEFAIEYMTYPIFLISGETKLQSSDNCNVKYKYIFISIEYIVSFPLSRLIMQNLLQIKTLKKQFYREMYDDYAHIYSFKIEDLFHAPRTVKIAQSHVLQIQNLCIAI